MFFKKKREAKAAAARDVKQKIQQDFERQLDEVELCADPAERFLKLEELQQAIDARIAADKEQIGRDALQKFRKTHLGVSTGTLLGVGGVALSLHIPPLMLLLYPAMIGANKAGRDAMAKEKTRLEAESAPLFSALAATRETAHERADAILATKLTAIAESPRFADILAKAPRIRDHFTAAFVKKVTGEDKAGPVIRKKPDNGFSL